MSKYEIQVCAEKCSGCLNCGLACSELHTKTFNPRAARVRVEFTGVDVTISFSDECNQCGTCADHCLYGALVKTTEQRS